MKVEIRDFPETKIAKLTHTGHPQRVFETAARFIEWRKSTGLSPIASSQTYGVPNGDPSRMEAGAFRFDVCGSIDRDVPANAFGVETGSLRGGRYAVLRHRGSHDGLEASVYALFETWLPDSGEEPGDAPLFFHYLNLVHQVDECDLMTDIYLPLR